MVKPFINVLVSQRSMNWALARMEADVTSKVSTISFNSKSA